MSEKGVQVVDEWEVGEIPSLDKRNFCESHAEQIAIALMLVAGLAAVLSYSH